MFTHTSVGPTWTQHVPDHVLSLRLSSSLTVFRLLLPFILESSKEDTFCVEIKGSRWCSRAGAILDATDTKRRDAVDNVYWRISVLIRAPDGVEDTAVGGTN